MGLLYFSPKGWASITTALLNLPSLQLDRLSMTQMLSLLLKQGKDIAAIPYNDIWGEVDTETDLSIYRNFEF